MTTIPADSIAIDDDTAWWIVNEDGWQLAETHGRPCDTCEGLGCDMDFCRECGDEYTDPCNRHEDHAHETSDDGCCPDCHGTGRHTFEIEVACGHDTASGHGGYRKCSGVRTLTVSVVPGMVLPIVGTGKSKTAPTECCVKLYDLGEGDITTLVHNSGALEPFSVDLPDAAKPGDWAVQLLIHKGNQ